MDLNFEEAPCEISDVIKMNYSFDNLHKFLNFLVLNDKDNFSKLKNIKIKLMELDDIKENLDENNSKISNFEQKFNQIDSTINSFFQKFNEMDIKITSNDSKIGIFHEELRAFQQKIQIQEENMNNLNRITEENIKTIFKQSEIIEKMRNTNETFLEKSDKHDKALLKLQNEVLKFNDIEKGLRDHNSRLDDNSKNFSDFSYFVNKKFCDLDSNIENIIDNINNFNKQIEKKGNSSVNMNNVIIPSQVSNETNYSQMLNEITKNNKEIDNFKKLFRNINETVDKHNKSNISFEEQFKEIFAELKESKIANANIKANLNAIINNNNNHNENNGNNVNIFNDYLQNNKGDFTNNTNLNSELIVKENDIFNYEDNNNNDLVIETDSIKNSVGMLYNKIKKIQEALKNITSTLIVKADKSDLEKISKSFVTELEKINGKIAEFSKNTDNKIKNALNNKNNSCGGIGRKNNREERERESVIGGNSNNNNITVTTVASENINSEENKNNKVNSEGKNIRKEKVGSFQGGFEFDEAIVQMTKEMLDQELGSNEEIIRINEFMEEYKNKIDLNKNEIDKIFESIVEIRKGLFDNINLKGDFTNLQDKINEIEDIVYKQRNYFEDRLKSYDGEGDEYDEANINDKNNNTNILTGGNIKENVKNLNVLFKQITDKVEKIGTRQDNINGDILIRVKKDLSIESGKILNEFREDLKDSITIIENKLCEKVDKFSLEEMGRKVDTKILSEMQKKIDKNDLKKNNQILNKKIDILETKISKTLVDTLIDLQMEEAPLILKKTFNPLSGNINNEKEKCASCNQVIYSNSNGVITEEQRCSTHAYTNSHSNTSTNNNPNATKYRFKNVQENCYKYGAGSYSRYLNSIDNAEDLRIKSLLLPDISNGSIPININGNLGNKTTKKFVNLNNQQQNENRFKNKLLEDVNEKVNLNNYGHLINEELEKKLLNPESLIKTANKAFENFEKEKKNDNKK